MATSHTSTGTVATGDTTAESLLSSAETAMATGAGLKRVEVDGQVTEWDRSTGMKERSDLKREVAREAGRRPAISRLDLAQAWG